MHADMPSDRPHQFKIMLSSDEKAWLDEIATERGITATDFLRQHIRDSHATLGHPDDPTPSPALDRIVRQFAGALGKTLLAQASKAQGRRDGQQKDARASKKRRGAREPRRPAKRAKK
jgi:hypothetical protein